MSTELAIPPILIDVRTGEALEPTPENAAAIKTVIREERQKLKDADEMCNHVLLDHAHRLGARSFRVGGFKVESVEPKEYVWAIDILRELQKLGLPEERWSDLVTETVDYKVSAVVAKQLSAVNEDYRRVIEAARQTHDKPGWVKVTT